MRKRNISLLTAALLILLAAAVLPGCGETRTESGRTYFYLGEQEDILLEMPFDSIVETTDGMVEECAGLLASEPSGTAGKPLLDKKCPITKYELNGEMLTLHFPETYYSMSKTREVLVRAGIVRSFVQIEGVERVQFMVGGSPLHDEEGTEIGPMRAESFIDNTAQQVNNYERDAVVLFFANEEGDGFVVESRAIYHSSSQPLEWAVVSRLIEGPKAEGSFATLNTDVEIISVSTAQNICYVNLSGSFLNNTLAVEDEIPVYSIVNSLVESCHVSQVQISVEGDTKVLFRDSVDLSGLFEENTESF